MEIGIPHSIRSDAGEIVFNILDGTATNADSLAGLLDVVAPVGLPDGNGYLLTQIVGMDDADVRNPITNKPHTDGAIVHRFRRAPKFIRVEGLIVASKPQYRVTLDDALRTVLDACLHAGVFGQLNENGARWFWTPKGKATRFHTVYLYEPLEIVAGGEIAAPKTFSFTLVAERPWALTYTQSVLTLPITIPNAGNAETWPVFKVYATGSFTLARADGWQLIWKTVADGGHGTVNGDYIEIDMFRQTMYWDGDGANALSGLVMASSDFWPVPVGGIAATCEFTTTVLSNDAWVG